MQTNKILKSFTVVLLVLSLLVPNVFAIGSTDVPLRSAFESIGMSVKWNDGGTIDLLVDDLKIVCSVGSEKLTAYNRTYTMTGQIYIEDERSYIPSSGVSLIKNIILFNHATVDAIVADQDEILPLKSIHSTEEVLVCTWHKYPDSYKDGAAVTTKYGEVWVFTADEIEEFLKNNQTEDMVLRLEQLIGLPPQKGNTHFSFLWVKPEDLFRPSRDSEITDETASLTFPANATAEHRSWFNENCLYSYQNHNYPWTGLGYTYDWLDDDIEYGLSEFVIKANREIRVEKTYSNEEFFAKFNRP